MASSAAAITVSTAPARHRHHSSNLHVPKNFFPKPISNSKSPRPLTKPCHVSPSPTAAAAGAEKKNKESIFFDGGAHYGDLLANLLLGFTLVWLPLSAAAVLRAFFLRYSFTNLRVTVISGLTGGDRSDFSYDVVKDVQVVPRFIGEWGDIIITLKDGTKVDLRSVPKFREIAKYCLAMADNNNNNNNNKSN